MNVLFVFAHQDDEIALASRIRSAVTKGDRVTCLCLTDGATNVAVTIRDAETRRVLARLGVEDYRIAPAGVRIADGTLPDHLDRALDFLESQPDDFGEVVTLAWEGGHQDHDAAHLVAAVFARGRGLRCIELPLYNGDGVRGPLFRVNHPTGEGWRERKLPWREYLSNILLARFYTSQRRTWLGLGPLLLLRQPAELTREADLHRAAAPPHPLPLLYERRFRYPYDRFAARAAEFLRRRSVPG
jgi:LmbE family N-acetylglucosaminyl deacetylase